MQNRKHHFKESWIRSFTKTVTYRILIVVLNFFVIYLMTDESHLAMQFTLISSIYTSIGYYTHERFWNHVKWGKKKHARTITPTAR